MKLHIFSGTSEGRELCAFLSHRGVQAETYNATPYSGQYAKPMKGISVHTGRLDEEGMTALFNPGDLVIDATHPYAATATRNLKTACRNTGAEYWRLVRPETGFAGLDTVSNMADAAGWLNDRIGRALITTGSRELETFTSVKDFQERLYVRVLPDSGVLRKCEELGFTGKHIIAMQGPFSHEMNVALIHSIGAKYLVTKDAGGRGGFPEKLSAAKETGAHVLVITRPTVEQGMNLAQIKHKLSKRFGLKAETDAERRFPLFVSLRGRRCIVFGAGKIAERRVEALKSFGAKVSIIAPESRSELTPDMRRGYETGDLEGVFLAVAATDSRETNRRIGDDCRGKNIPCSVADSAEESSFFFPAVCKSRELTAGIVSKGVSHRKTAYAAKRIREILEEIDGTD